MGEVPTVIVVSADWACALAGTIGAKKKAAAGRKTALKGRRENKALQANAKRRTETKAHREIIVSPQWQSWKLRTVYAFNMGMAVSAVWFG
jgi:hypothetical protein